MPTLLWRVKVGFCKAYFDYQDKVIKFNIPDAKPLMYDSWMLAMAVDNGENGNG